MTTPISAVITTYNNSDTLVDCLDSLAFADELLVLDSLSEDASPAIARAKGARLEQQAFAGYGLQKQKAIDLASHDWVLLLDADERLSPELADEIIALLQAGPDCTGYKIPRREWLYWRWQHPATRLVDPVRLFDRRHARMNQVPVHAAIELDGKAGQLRGSILHLGERNVTLKVEKINYYSSGLVEHKLAAKPHFLRTRMVFYPAFAFLREYLLRRQFLNGWAGFIAARSSAFYAFIKYAKVFEAQRAKEPPVASGKTAILPEDES